MQLAPLSPADRSTALTQPIGATQRPAGPTAQAQPQAGNTPARLPRQGLRVWTPDLNRQVANAQQSLNYLDALGSQLESVKAQLSHKLAGGYARDGALQTQQQRLTRLWNERAEQSGHSLDAQLEYSGNTPAQQHFRIRGLEPRNVQANGLETLAFTLHGSSRQTMAVRVEPGLSAATLASRFDQALAPAGIRVSATAQGELDFTVPESQWPRLRDTLAIKGDGKRFPTGQFSRAPVQSAPAIIEPGAWQLDDPAGLRQALPQIVRAAQQTGLSRSVVQGALADADRALSQSPTAEDAPVVQAYAQSFADQTSGANYPLLSALSPSLLGLPRYRIESLLALQ